jgi:hypothetical protein
MLVSTAPSLSESVSRFSIPPKISSTPRLREELRRSADAGHFGNEGWQIRKGGSRFPRRCAAAASDATLEQVERDHIPGVPRERDSVVTTAATRLGLHRITLNAMMRKPGISRKGPVNKRGQSTIGPQARHAAPIPRVVGILP